MEWDTWGCLTKVGSHTYFWDYTDRLTKFDHATGTSNDATYGYLPGSWQRYKRVQDTTVEYYIYDGDNVLASYASNGTLNARYITPGLDENVSMTRSGNTYYYMADGLGSIRNIGESDEDTANIYDYYAFGDSLGTQTQGVTNPYRFTGREYESGSVLDTYYYRNRYYLSALGIFASRDPFEYDLSRGWQYVRNNPVNLTDPWGEMGVCAEAKAKGLVNNVGGAVICKDGKKHWCVYAEKSNEGIQYCIAMHERDHGDDVDCPPCDPNVTRPPFKPGADSNKEECAAYKVELSCLQKEKPFRCNKLRGEKRKACQKEFDDRIAQMQQGIARYCK